MNSKPKYWTVEEFGRWLPTEKIYYQYKINLPSDITCKQFSITPDEYKRIVYVMDHLKNG